MGWSPRVGWMFLVALGLGCGGVVRERSRSNGAAGSTGNAGSTGIAGSGGSSDPGTPSCVYQGRGYASGESFPAGDGCNTCSCDADGSVGCTEIGCGNAMCFTLEAEYGKYIESAATCMSDGDCALPFPSALTCGCPRWVNASRMMEIYQATMLTSEYANLACAPDVACAPCQPLHKGYCVRGNCIDLSLLK